VPEQLVGAVDQMDVQGAAPAQLYRIGGISINRATRRFAFPSSIGGEVPAASAPASGGFLLDALADTCRAQPDSSCRRRALDVCRS
jgi:hypothetical protein